jgi:prepilin-type N-terminal cleavage/methylation domain-containing protein/prepilin-type processing-associated H-X9-DG protein
MRTRGFTLVELLVVMGILVVLAGIAVPAYQQVTARSRAAHCLGNLRQLGVALNLYLGENNLTMPVMAAARASANDEEPAVDTVLARYVSGPEVFRCLADREKIWQETGTSYFWNSLLNGQSVAALEILGREVDAGGVPVLADKESFHKRVGDEVNILYADGHVREEVQFRVGRRNDK